MFTAFTLAMLVYKAQDAVFTTDSDTILDPAALRQMSYVLGSDPNLGGVTGDVKIWNKNESWLALMCALRYWFAVSLTPPPTLQAHFFTTDIRVHAVQH